MRTSLAALAVAAVALAAPGTVPQGLSLGTSGPLVAVSARTGSVQDFPRIAGKAVYAIADDGAGGWFVGGEFASADGVACRNLVHVGSNRTVDRSWCPRPDGVVRALERVHGTLYVGAEGMHRIGGTARAALAALDVKSGHVHSWSPGTPGRTIGVLDLSADPGRGVVFVTGEFVYVGGKARIRQAGLSLASGRATTFAPNPDENTHGDSAVGTVAAAGSVYAWGSFTRVGGLPRDSFARLDPVTGHARAAVVSPICPTTLLAVGRRLYAGTDTSCEGTKGPLRALTLPAVNPVPSFRPALPRRYVEALGSAPGLLVVAAAEDHVSSSEPRLVVGLDPRSGRRLFTSAAHPRGPVATAFASGDLVLLGGRF